MKPADKSPAIRGFQAMLMAMLGKGNPEECIRKDICVSCGKPATQFRNELARMEFSISGLCQTCQDGVFGPPPGEGYPA